VKEKNERKKQNFFALLGPFWFSQVAIIEKKQEQGRR
jgi:hypothetical protein